MFTTRIGPPQLKADYLKMLEDYLQQNLVNDPELRPILAGRAGTEDVAQLRNEQFDLFFKLAVPKVIAAILLDEDWYVDPEMGIKVYEFTRADAENPYVMLHLVMDVKRQHPPKENRPPAGAGQLHTAPAAAAYQSVARKVFQESGIVVVEDQLDANELNRSLELIKARRKKYHPDDI